MALAVSPFFVSDGKVIGATEFRKDITERKIPQKALCEIEVRHKVIWEHIDDIIYFVSVDRKIVSVNPGCEKITGWPAEYWIGREMPPYLMDFIRVVPTKKRGYMPLF
jgi:PAS domain-containing protein